MAENLAKAGINVTIVEMADHLIAPLDVDMAAEVHRYIQDQGVGLMLKNGVQAIEPGKDGLKLRLSKGQLKADMVILSVGVRPDTALARQAGLKTNGGAPFWWMSTCAPRPNMCTRWGTRWRFRTL